MTIDERVLAALLCCCFPLGVFACGASSADTTGAPRIDGDAGTVADTSPDTGATDTAPPPPPPEKEVESSYESPVATGKYVWIANPKRLGRVAYVDAATLDVRVVEAGNGPTYLAAVPSPASDDVALVLNVLSDDATMLRKTPLGLTATRFETHHGANAWQVSTDGRWAIAWTDAKGVASPDKTQGFQDLTVIDLTEKVPPTILAVGYRPVKVGFTKDGSRAYAVTQDGISIVSLGEGGPLVTKNVPISENPLEDPGTRDVSVTPDGAWALIRRDGVAEVGIVGLDAAARTTIPLDGPVTDLDLAEDGTRAIAVVRDHAEAVILPIPGVVTKPTEIVKVTIPGETIGSVSIAKTATTAVLYTNAVPAERFTVLRTDGASTPTWQVMKLYSPVLAVFPTDDAKNAIVVHDRPATPTTGRAGAFSVVPIAAGLPAKIVGTDAPITAVALSPSSDRAFLAERDDAKKVFGVYVAKMPSLAVDRYPLASPPIAVGVVAGANRAYVAQEHAEGRITFIDLEKGQARTLTGFELGARVVDGP